jgi:glutamate-1-semialdehyde 2,1-aminomutase
VYGVVPDLSTFGKALANGFALSALAGRRDIMELGGIRTDRDRVFLMSTTHGAESHALAAGMATMRFYAENDVTGVLHRQGRRLREGVQQHVERLGLTRHFRMEGRDCCLFYVTADQDGKPSQALRTLFLQETISRGVIAPAFVPSYSHSDVDIDITVEVVGEALEIYARAVQEGASKYLRGRPVQPVFRPRA